jgi:2-desacetyl-2-hydroxyethyl bacteriochlorophyllide A dehydrogenase
VAGRRIRAAYHRAPGILELGEAVLPEPASDEVVVRVEACGVCATNLDGWARAPDGPAARPGTHGHEIAGVVEQVGDAVTRVAPGDRVCLDPAAACGCGRCAACIAGDPMRCRAQAWLPVWGFAEALVAPERGVVRVPDGLDLVTACLAEPLASAVHGLRHSHAAAATGRIDGAHVLVVGAGALGLLTVAAARRLGAALVTVVARHPHQAALAAAVGADAVVPHDAPGLAEALRKLRAPLVVEAAGGRAPTLALALGAVDRGGEVVVLGLFDEPQAIDAHALVMRNVRVFFAAAYGARDGRSDVEVAVDVLFGAPALGALVTHRLALEDVARAPLLAASRADGVVRLVLHP